MVNPGKTNHSNSIGSPSILSKVPHCGASLNQLNCSSQTVFDIGFWFIFPRHNLCARNWWLLHHWPEITVSMENFPSWFETLQKSHPIVPISTVQISRTSSLKWDFPLYFWWNVNCLSNSSPWTQMLPMSKTEHSPNHWTFVNVLHWIFWRTVQHLSQSVIHSVQEWTWF